MTHGKPYIICLADHRDGVIRGVYDAKRFLFLSAKQTYDLRDEFVNWSNTIHVGELILEIEKQKKAMQKQERAIYEVLQLTPAPADTEA